MANNIFECVNLPHFTMQNLNNTIWKTMLLLWHNICSLRLRILLPNLYYIFNQEMFGSTPIYHILTSCTRSSYTPWYKTEISRMGENHRKTCRSCKNELITACIRYILCWNGSILIYFISLYIWMSLISWLHDDLTDLPMSDNEFDDKWFSRYSWQA